MKLSLKVLYVLVIASMTSFVFAKDSQESFQKELFEKYYDKSHKVSLFVGCEGQWYETYGGRNRRLTPWFKKLYKGVSPEEIYYEKKSIYILNTETNKFEKHKLDLAFTPSGYEFPESCIKQNKDGVEKLTGIKVTRENLYGYKDIFGGETPQLGRLLSFSSAKNNKEYDVFEYELNGKKQIIFIDYKVKPNLGFIFLKSNDKSVEHKQLFPFCFSIIDASERTTGELITDQNDGFIGCDFREQHEYYTGFNITKKNGIFNPVDFNGDGYLDIEIISFVRDGDNSEVFWLSNKDGTYTKMYGQTGVEVKSTMEK